MARFKIVIKDEEPPFERDADKYIKFLCDALGITTGRDRKGTSCRVFKRVVKHSSEKGVTTTKEICEDIDMSRGAVVNQINKMIKAGMIRKEGSYYVLRRKNLIRTILEMRRDTLRMFERVEKIAKELDEEMGLPKEKR
ncbi:MAG: hypothetical protein U9N35_06185 [Euryarchaeota archaeon]|nr:hypothetical protein [Euryarchaeota archaeon]